MSIEYNINGFYIRDDLKVDISGEFKLSDDLFEGKLYTHAPDKLLTKVDNENIIVGKFRQIDPKTIFSFYSFKKGDESVDFYFQLYKSISDSIEGRYHGNWHTLFDKVRFGSNAELANTRQDLRIVKARDLAELIISKK